MCTAVTFPVGSCVFVGGGDYRPLFNDRTTHKGNTPLPPEHSVPTGPHGAALTRPARSHIGADPADPETATFSTDHKPTDAD